MRFQWVQVTLCSAGHKRWHVRYADGTDDVLHFGNWPMSLSEVQRQQLREASQAFDLRLKRFPRRPAFAR